MGVLALIVLGGALRSGPIQAGPIEAVPNPLGLGWIPGDPDTTLDAHHRALRRCVGDRRRSASSADIGRAASIVRAQIRWFAAAIVASLALLIVTALSPGNDTVSAIAWSAWIAVADPPADRDRDRRSFDTACTTSIGSSATRSGMAS